MKTSIQINEKQWKAITILQGKFGLRLKEEVIEVFLELIKQYKPELQDIADKVRRKRKK